ncbi:MAG: tetrahydrofolate dehydrogenase/cyclohydrolase catalytic domain-containing protein, partial [Pseudonocardiaceae bacterium]
MLIHPASTCSGSSTRPTDVRASVGNRRNRPRRARNGGATSLTGELAATTRSRVTAQAAGLTAAGVKPRLAIVTATDDASSACYVSSLSRTAANVGITCDV